MNIGQQNVKCSSIHIKSLNQKSEESNPEELINKKCQQSHLVELILQKYNFCSQIKPTTTQNLLKRNSICNANSVINSHMIIVSRLPKIQHSCSLRNELSIRQRKNVNPQTAVNSIQKQQNEHCLRLKNSLQSVQNYGYDSIKINKRRLSDYKQCKQRIQMNTTYRGFNLSKKTKNHEKRYPQYDFSYQEQHQSSKGSVKAAQRKMIINYIIEKGYAKRKEEQLAKARNQKKKNVEAVEQPQNFQPNLPFRSKKSVIFSKAFPILSQQQIDPW